VAEYLQQRFAGSRFPADLVRLIHERTDGNPFFLVTLVDHLLVRGAIAERNGRWQVEKGLRGELAAVPESLRLLIEQQLERLESQDRELLEAASLAGVKFSAAAAAAAGMDLASAEERLDRLALASPFLRPARAETWPDGTVATCFGFRHSLYREVLAARLSPRVQAEKRSYSGEFTGSILSGVGKLALKPLRRSRVASATRRRACRAQPAAARSKEQSPTSATPA
jgi:predicted ATPase